MYSSNSIVAIHNYKMTKPGSEVQRETKSRAHGELKHGLKRQDA